MTLDLIEVVDYVFLGNKIVIISKIPISKQVDNFYLTNIITLPVKIGDHYFRAKYVEGEIAIGEKYRVKIGKCKKYKNKKFCKALSSYRSVIKDNSTCIGNILANRNNLLEYCNWELVNNMENWVLNIEGTYFYSLNKTIILELFCIESKHNDRITLEGLGKVKIASGCYAKYDSILLVGSKTAKLNSTFVVTNSVHSMLDQNFTMLKNFDFKNMSFSNIIDTPLPDSKEEFSHKLKNFSFEYIEILIFLIILAIIIYIIVVIIKCIKFLHSNKKNKVIKIIKKVINKENT